MLESGLIFNNKRKEREMAINRNYPNYEKACSKAIKWFWVSVGKLGKGTYNIGASATKSARYAAKKKAKSERRAAKQVTA